MIKGENLNISPEVINELSEYFNNHIINENTNDAEQIKNEIDKSLESICMTVGTNFKSIKDNITNKYASFISNIIKEEGINKSSLNKISVMMENFNKEIADSFHLSDTALLKFKEYDMNKIKSGFLLLLYVTIMNTIFASIFQLLFGLAGYYLVVMIVGPINEEFAKKLAIKGGFITEFTIIFNTFEMTSYVSNMAKVFPNTNISKLIKIRAFPVMMHLVTTIVQFISNSKWIQDKLNLNKEEDKDKISFIGQIIGCIIHISWNTISLIFNNKIMQSLIN